MTRSFVNIVLNQNRAELVTVRRTHVGRVMIALLIGAGVLQLVSTAWAQSPTITSQPQSQSLIRGGRAVFTVLAQGAASLLYQWRKNGAVILGATNSGFVLENLQFADAGIYSVLVSNSQSTAISADAGLSVNPPQGGDLDYSFYSGSSINGNISSLAVQSDGKIVIGGSFSTVSGAVRRNLARLNPDGSTDHTFQNGMIGINNNVNCITIQPDGKVLVGGEFTFVNGVNRNRIARLNSDGSLDVTFQNGMNGANSIVERVALQGDGKVLIAGLFTTINGTNRNEIARLNSDGSLDTTFQNGMNGVGGNPRYVVSMAVQTNGQVLIGGVFTSVNGVGRTNIARLNADGSLDNTFLNGMTGVGGWEVFSLAMQTDGKVLIGGDFESVNGVSRTNIARLNEDGSLDTGFLNGMKGANSYVRSIAALEGGKVLIGGEFTSVNGTNRGRIARLNTDGSLDTAFGNGASGVNGPTDSDTIGVSSIVTQGDGKLIIGGWGFDTVNGTNRTRIARLNTDGSLDAGFQSWDARVIVNSPFSISSVAVQSNGMVLIAGGFTNVNGLTRNRVARLKTDGSLDTGFQNGMSGVTANAGNTPWVNSVAIQPDGKVLIGGGFNAVNGTSRNQIARLNPDGTLDTTFQNGTAGVVGAVYSVTFDQYGRVLIGGRFDTVNGVTRNGIARLNANGTLDATFQNGMNGVGGSYEVNVVAMQSDGKVLIGGEFPTVNGTNRNRIARLNDDGSLDLTFQNGMSGANAFVSSLAVQTDGKMLVGGGFTLMNGASRGGIARLNTDGSVDATFQNWLSGANYPVSCVVVQTNGAILIGGGFTTVSGMDRGGIARLNTDGSLDPTFLSTQSGVDGTVNALGVQSDGKILIGGQFTVVNGVPANYIARLHGVSPPTPPPPIIYSYEGSLGFVAGQFGFIINGQLGQLVVIEASTTLQPGSWMPVRTNVLGGGPIYFSDPESRGLSSRYYRAKSY